MAEEGKRNYLPSMWPLSLRPPPPPQQNKGIAENAERTNNVPTRERRARERLVFIGDCNNICRRRQRSSPLTPGESVNVRACGMEDGIIRTLPCSFALFAQRTNVMWRRSRPRPAACFIVTPHLEKADSSTAEDKRSSVLTELNIKCEVDLFRYVPDVPIESSGSSRRWIPFE